MVSAAIKDELGGHGDEFAISASHAIGCGRLYGTRGKQGLSRVQSASRFADEGSSQVAVFVREVVPGSRGQAGIQPGDIILRVQGKPVVDVISIQMRSEPPRWSTLGLDDRTRRRDQRS